MGEGKRGEAALGSGSVAVTGSAGSEGASVPPREAGRPAAVTYNRVRGIFLLLVMALLGFGLSRLRDVGRPELAKGLLAGPGGQSIFIVVEKREGGRAWPFEPEVRLVLSRLPLEFDTVRSVIFFRERPPQVVARSWPTVLVDASGRIEPWRLRLEPEEAEALSRLGFEQARDRLSQRDPGLVAFWKR